MLGGGPNSDIYRALARLNERAAAVRLPLEVTNVAEARQLAADVTRRLRDYVLPRVLRLDAPLLAVIGGSTGVGKSTLVNTFVGRMVSQSGILRPTTRCPVLVHHPDDAAWFRDDRLLPDLARTTDTTPEPGTLRVLADDAVPAGIGFVDAPDIDSVVTANRELGTQLLEASDLWLFVTSATRYADAVPWDFLGRAARRQVAVVMILDRVSPDNVEEISDYLVRMLNERGLSDVPLYVVPESELLDDGLLPDEAINDLKQRIAELARDPAQRSTVVRQTLTGAIDDLVAEVPGLAAAVEAQLQAMGRLRADAAQSYGEASDAVAAASRDGSLIRGEVLGRWQAFVGTGEIVRSLDAHPGKVRDRPTDDDAVRPGQELAQALRGGLEAVILDAADHAAERVEATWRADPAGRGLLRQDRGDGADPGLGGRSADLATSASAAMEAWRAYLVELVTKQETGRSASAFGAPGLGLVLMVAVVTRFDDPAVEASETGIETDIRTAETSTTELDRQMRPSGLARAILAAAFGEEAVRGLLESARTDLWERVEALLEKERSRYDVLLDDLALEQSTADGVREDVRAVEVAR